MSVQNPHPALQTILEGPRPSTLGSDLDDWMTTSPSLAQALAVGCLAGLDQSLTKIDIWDPAVGSGYAGGMLADALTAAGINVRYRGQDINERAVVAARDRLASVPDAEVVQADTLGEDRFANFNADLVIVDAPWGLNWQTSGAAVHARRDRGEFRFGLPQGSDSTWLFISLALEKIRPASQGGGRVAALVAPSALSSGGSTEELRRAIMVAGLIESVTRLPEGLAPNTGIPLYLLTFTNATGRVARDTAMIADLRAQFTTDKGRRSILRSAFDELESGLRRWKPGPRSRVIRTSQFIRRDATLGRITSEGRKLSWRLTSFNDTPVDSDLLESRYGPESGIAVDGSPRETVDLDPSHHFSDDAGDILKSLAAAGWSARRLTTLLASEPTPSDGTEESNASIFVPTTRVGVVSTASAGTNSEGRVLRVPLDEVSIDTGFLAAWLNSELGESSRRRAIDAGSTGALVRALRSDAGSLMRWADEMIVPVPPHEVQTSVVTADERLASFQSELDRRRASIWTAPDTADAVVDSVAGAFDDSLSSWIEQLPYPIATALWTAETAASLGDKQLAYIHAWEAIVAFHATILLSACRSIPGTGDEMQASIRRALDAHGLTIERATFGTWVLIAEKASSVVRQALYSNDRDELARVRAVFGDLGQASIARLASKDLIKKFNEANSKRNKWNGHSGYTSDDERQDQIESLVADLIELRQILGDVWSQLTLVRAGGLERGRDGYVQTAEVALGAKSPFRRNVYRVGDPMVAGDLYLVKDGSERPLHLLQFVQLRSSSRDTRCTTYFYNRIEGSSVRLVSYQSGSESELMENVASFVDDFGQLVGP